MTTKIVPYSAPIAPQVDGLTTVFVIREFGKISNSIKTILGSRAAARDVVTVATLPAAASNKSVRYVVSDATVTTFWTVVVGGGTNVVPVTSDGAAWRIG